MNAIDYLKQHGLAAKLRGKRVHISPANRVTDDLRRYIKAHRMNLIAELTAADGQARHSGWAVLVEGYRPFTMISEPLSHPEALAAARHIWPNAEVEPRTEIVR